MCGIVLVRYEMNSKIEGPSVKGCPFLFTKQERKAWLPSAEDDRWGGSHWLLYGRLPRRMAVFC